MDNVHLKTEDDYLYHIDGSTFNISFIGTMKWLFHSFNNIFNHIKLIGGKVIFKIQL